MSNKYDVEKIYDEKINPLMAEIINICKENGIKYFADFYLKDRGEDEIYYTSCDSGDNEMLKNLYRVAMKGWTVQKPYFAAVTITRSKEEST